jgi:hypothetical protein
MSRPDSEKRCYGISRPVAGRELLVCPGRCPPFIMNGIVPAMSSTSAKGQQRRTVHWKEGVN